MSFKALLCITLAVVTPSVCLGQEPAPGGKVTLNIGLRKRLRTVGKLSEKLIDQLVALRRKGDPTDPALQEQLKKLGLTAREALLVAQMIEYTIYDPKAPTTTEEVVLRQLEPKDRNGPLSLRGFSAFSVGVHLGFKSLTYVSELRPSDNALFWISEEHAGQIGRCLRSMDYFGLTFTMFEGTGMELLAKEVGEDVRIAEIVISHKSGDECTTSEARGVARLVTKVKAKTLHLWAGEYDKGALDALAAELKKLGNTTLLEADVCDVSIPEPNDRIRHEAIEGLVRANGKKAGR